MLSLCASEAAYSPVLCTTGDRVCGVLSNKRCLQIQIINHFRSLATSHYLFLLPLSILHISYSNAFYYRLVSLVCFGEVHICLSTSQRLLFTETGSLTEP